MESSLQARSQHLELQAGRPTGTLCSCSHRFACTPEPYHSRGSFRNREHQSTEYDLAGFIGHPSCGFPMQRTPGLGSGEGLSLPQRGSRAKPAPGRLRRSAAVRGRSHREGGVERGETHSLLTTVSTTRRRDRPRMACGSRARSECELGCRTPRCSRGSTRVRPRVPTTSDDWPTLA